MIRRVHHLLDPEGPDLVAGRFIIWASILANPPFGTTVLNFKYNRRWYRAVVRPHGYLRFETRAGKEVSAKVESNLIRFLVEAE